MKVDTPSLDWNTYIADPLCMVVLDLRKISFLDLVKLMYSRNNTIDVNDHTNFMVVYTVFRFLLVLLKLKIKALSGVFFMSLGYLRTSSRIIVD